MSEFMFTIHGHDAFSITIYYQDGREENIPLTLEKIQTALSIKMDLDILGRNSNTQVQILSGYRLLY